MVGGLLLVCLLAGALALALQPGAWQRWWFELEDPRSIALFRIVFAALALCNVHNLWDSFDFLFTGDGLFTGEQAARQFAPALVAPDLGFLGRVFAVVTGPTSLLYFCDGPTAFWLQLAVFELAGVLLVLGLRTRLAGLVLFFAMDGLLVRNFLFWEGTELVYRVFLAYLVCARSGHAYSLDNWLRRRTRPHEPVHRAIPAWPRRLAVVQLAVILGSTGLLKTGAAWLDGSAVYDALHSDHYARFPMHGLAAWLGPDLLRLATWAARTIEALFPLVLVGLIARRPAAPLTRARRLAVRLCLLVLLLAATLVVAIAGQPRLLPVHTPAAAALVWLVVCGSAIWAPSRARWIYGRRIWVTCAAALLLGMWALMNIGWFHPGMLAALLLTFDGLEVATLLRRSGRLAHRLGISGIPLDVARGDPPRPAVAGDLSLAYTSTGRRILGALLAWHLLALAIAAIPASSHTDAFRVPLQRFVGPWLQATHTRQSWGMWAPEPRMDNHLLKVVVVDRYGRRWDMRTDIYAREPRFALAYDRWHKMAGRILGTGPDGPYQRPYARWHCRRWPLQDDGRPARQVELRELSYRISPLADLRTDGPSTPAEQLARAGTERTLLVHPCE